MSQDCCEGPRNEDGDDEERRRMRRNEGHLTRGCRTVSLREKARVESLLRCPVKG